MFVDISQGKITIIFFISPRSEIWDQDIHMQRKKIKERKIKQSILLTLKKTFLMFLMIEEQNVWIITIFTLLTDRLIPMLT